MMETIVDTPKERRDAAEHRRRILVAARALFAAQGIDATNMTEIARTANIGQGTLYRRFAHKGELCEALLKENMLCFEQVIVNGVIEDQSATTLERLKRLFTEMVRFNEMNHPLLAAMMDSANGQRRAEYFHSPFYVWMHGTIVRLLQQGIAAGELQEIDVELSAHLMMASLKGTLYCYQQKQLGYSSEQIIQSVCELLIEGLRARQ
jgi:AcrR family transcriptional regulator